MTAPAAVRVPCSTSNLGAGFDCIGLALDRYLEVAFEPGGDTVLIERAGTLAGLTVEPAGDAVVAAFRSALGARGVGMVHGLFRMNSSIPIARGLGSSAAATVAGLLLAGAVTGEQPAPSRLLDAAARIEGHPDNAAPALLGGLVAVTRTTDPGQRAFRLPLSESLGFAFAAPSAEVSTARARRVLPGNVPHEMAVRALGRVAALVRGLETGDTDLLRAGFEDELHVPYRLPLIPGAADAFDAALGAGAHVVTISGSGSGLLAICRPVLAAAVSSAMADAFRQADPDAAGSVIAMALTPDFDGARLEESS